MAKVGKDDFVHGFVPQHNHGSVDYTGVAGNHVHQCLDVTSPPIMTPDGGHIHYTEGYVMFENGHTHHYRAYSGPAIPVGMFITMIFKRQKMMVIVITLKGSINRLLVQYRIFKPALMSKAGFILLFL
jgi:hypothetical protein